MNDTRADDPTSTTVLVAVEVPNVAIRNANEPSAWAQGIVSGLLHRATEEGLVTSWWIAEDERYDRSDNDSAVFVPKGEQAEWAKRVARLREFPPCTSCGSEFMDTEMCPNIKSECTDCCGCPDHGPVKVDGLIGFNIEFDGSAWEGHLVRDFAQALEVISAEFDKAGDARRITSIEFTYEGDE